jgi:putative component of toxin-antitoxin plasmid stabilization module
MKQARCKAQFEARFQVLALRGRLANPDQMRKLGGRVWEVKVNQGPGRRIYGCWDGKVFVLTHGGNKPRARGVATEVARAERLYDSWFQEEHKEDERP